MNAIEARVEAGEIAQVEAEANAIEAEAQRLNGYKVATRHDAEEAAGLRKAWKARLKKLDDTRKAMTRPLDESKARIMDLFRVPTQACTKAIDHIDHALKVYHAEEQRKIDELNRILAEQARAAEAKRRAELEVQIAAAQDVGDDATAMELSAKAPAVKVEAPVIPAVKAQASGIAYRSNWKAEVVDFPALVRYCAENPEHADFLQVNPSRLNEFAKWSKGTREIPGLRVHDDKIIAGTRG